MLDALPTISVIIPTYNRKNSLLRTLESLSRQTLPADRFVVIVVDDGSADDTAAASTRQFPYIFRYVRQKNQGATAARNYGVRLSQSDILVFIDDDVTISPQTLDALVKKCSQESKALVIGNLRPRSSRLGSIYAAVLLASSGPAQAGHKDRDLHFLHCNTELLACRRSDFLDLGMLQDPTEGHGWPNWDDVDLGYRAHLSGFRLVQSGSAVGEHWDFSLSERAVACQRWYRASKSAVWLFKKHHGLQQLIPMLYDKTPIDWGQDSPALIARKLARHIMSSQPILGGMLLMASLMERYFPSPKLLRRLYFWLQGAYMFHGYRAGLRELKQANA